MSCACGIQCERPCNTEPDSVCDDCQCRDAEHRAELDALRTSYEDANARGGEANERLQRQLREAEGANVMSAALIERLRAELAEARGQWVCSAGHRHGKYDVCNNPFPPAATPAESTPVQRIVMKETSWGGRYAVTQGEPLAVPADCGRCLDRARCIRNDKCADWGEGAGEDAKGEPVTHAKGAKP